MSEKQTEKSPAPAAQNTVLSMIVTMADTSWRMFVPILGGLLLGIYIDLHAHTKPWLTLLGLVVGVTAAALLVRDQFRRNAR